MPDPTARQESAYSMPQLAPAYPEGPIQMHLDATVASFEIDEGIYHDVLPAPLKPIKRPLCQIWAIDYDSVGYGQYYELAVCIVSLYEGDLVSYTPLLYVNQEGFPGIAAGREIWGAPKIAMENVHCEERGKEVVWVFGQGKTDQIVLSVTEDELVQDHSNLPVNEERMRMVSWKQIPSSEKGAPPAVNRIVAADVSDVVINRGTTGRAQFDVTRMADTPIHWFEPQTEPIGYRLDVEWVLDTAENAVLRVLEEHDPR